MNKKGFSLVYMLFLTTLVMLFAIVVLNKYVYVSSFSDRIAIQASLLKSLTTKYHSALGLFLRDPKQTQESLLGYIPKNQSYYTLFWHFREARDFFQTASPQDEQTPKITDITTGYIELDIENAFDLKIVQWDRDTYEQNAKLVALEESRLSFEFGQAGYLKNDDTITFGTGNIREFDFGNNDYAFFVASQDIGVGEYFRYEMKIYDGVSGSGVFFHPITTLPDDKIHFLGYDIQSLGSQYIFKILDFFH